VVRDTLNVNESLCGVFAHGDGLTIKLAFGTVVRPAPVTQEWVESTLTLVPASPIATHLRSAQDSMYRRFGKRAFDLVVASILLVVLLAPLLVILFIIRAESRGHPIFRQRRIGQHGKIFTLYKLRTMVHHAELILVENPQLKDAMAVRWKMENDPRVTRLGSFLRRTSIDELPQLLNVIRGDMSLVGPRPVQVSELAAQYGDAASLVTAVKPGMSGLWQVSGRSTLTYAERVILDVRYVAGCSLRLDLWILLKTIQVVILRHGAL
jgi:exopolysaccharide production protein ExoY